MCGERWSRDHKCATAVQLHVVQELFDVLGIPGLDMQSEHSDTCNECHTISSAALEGNVTPQTVRLQGLIQNQKVLMLIDSGSSHSFISENFTGRIAAKTEELPPVSVRVANGQRLLCNKLLRKLAWHVPRHTFNTDLRVLPLSAYDGVLGSTGSLPTV